MRQPLSCATLVTVRVTVCDPGTSAMPMLARFRSLASNENPFAARKSQLPGVKICWSVPHVKAAYSRRPASYTSPGWNIEPLFAMPPGLMCPAPKSNGSAGVLPSSFTTSWRAVVMIADFAAAGLQSGFACLSRANTPATCGLDIDVPEIDWNS